MRVDVVPIKELRRVTLTWFLPPMRQLYKQHALGCAAALHYIHARAYARTLTRSLSQSCARTHSHARPPAHACRFVGGLLGHEGEGSALSLLRKRRWAASLSAGVTEETLYHSGFEARTAPAPDVCCW